jgi:DNA polymerase I-like protein with 3'-5' exonuclease and polymerase domains
VCLGVIYGMGAQAMAARLGIQVGDAQHIMQAFFDRFNHVQAWMHRVKT